MSSTRPDLTEAAVWTLKRHRDEIARLRRGYVALASSEVIDPPRFAESMLDGHDPDPPRRERPHQPGDQTA